MASIDISKKSKAAVLAALYNRSRPQGLGFLNPSASGDMTEADAQLWIDVNGENDYLNGRVIKCDLRGDSFDPWLYDRDLGEGAAAAAVATVADIEVSA